MAKQIIRLVLGVIGGLAGAIMIILALQMIATGFSPVPKDLDAKDPATMAAHIASLPVSALLIVLATYAFGSLVGGFIATKLSQQYPLPATFVSGFLTVGAVLTFMAIPHPTWFMVLATISFLPIALLGGRLTGVKRTT